MNLSALNKLHRSGQITTDLGATAFLMIYSGAQPISPDITVSAGALLCAMPMSNPAGVVTYFLQAAAINNAGSGGTNGTQTVTGTTGTGTKFQASVTIAGGIITVINSVTVAGNYTVLPTLVGEPVTGASLTGATLNLAMSAQFTASAITQTNASSTGTASFGRLAANNTAGGAGLADLSIGTSGTEIIINTTAIATGGPIIASSAVFAEA